MKPPSKPPFPSQPREPAATMPLTPHVEWEPTSAGRGPSPSSPGGFGVPSPSGLGEPPRPFPYETQPMSQPAPGPASYGHTQPLSQSRLAPTIPLAPPMRPSGSQWNAPGGQPFAQQQQATQAVPPSAMNRVEEAMPPSTNSGIGSSTSQVTGPHVPTAMPVAYVVASAVFLAIAVLGFGLYLALEVF